MRIIGRRGGRTLKTVRTALSIAGSDPSGGAGIQADIKTMCALGVYAMTVITSVTAQNTQKVSAVADVDAGLVDAQIRAVFDDIGADAVKVGMVSNTAIIAAVLAALSEYRAPNVVVDPVMVAKSGDPLLREDAREALRGLVARALVVTPNIPEAEILAGLRPGSIADEAGMREAAERIAASGARNVLVKGGHGSGAESADILLLEDGRFLRLSSERIDTRNTHGTGCTLSAAIASRLALGDDVEAAVRAAKAYITQAIRDALSLGGGHGPVGHLSGLYRRARLAEGE
jgi:hydroxymethylpyrimidine/phosphomethylpyrimidine kinase